MNRPIFLFAVTFILPLAGCATGDDPTLVEERIVRVDRPVIQPCVEGVRPAVPVPLRSLYTQAQWDAMDVKQKAAAVAAQGLRRQTYGEQLHAVTGACP